MKKIGVLGGILIILGGAAFFFGWVQLAVPPGAYGVMRSKTHGLDPHIIREGNIRWVWYKLIPGNVDIQVFTLRRITRSFKIRDALPSGSEYASFAGFAIDFSYETDAALSFAVKPDSLISLMDEQNITDQQGLEAFETELADQIEAFALQRLRLYMGDEQKIEEILHSGSSARLERDLAEAFPGIETLSCFIHTADFPDFTLYHQFRSLYEDYIARIRNYIQTEKLVQPEIQVASYIRLDELAKYGELLTKYPILLQYLALEKDARR
ncbi:MAG: hypothetical protein LBD55_12175 [Treponema sp.]|jgi:hypothetical protein|nr:hypothetical protein [Treponema sp.]